MEAIVNEPIASGGVVMLRLWGQRQRIPFRAQSSEIDCGAACLSMLLARFGRHVRVNDLAIECEAGRHGISAMRLGQVALRHGMRLHGRAMSLEELKGLRTPAILHWSFSHWVVCERVSLRSATIIDPSRGRRVLGWEEISDHFTGIVLLAEQIDTALPNKDRITFGRSVACVLAGLPKKQIAWALGGLVLCSAMAQLLGIVLARISGALFKNVSASSGPEIINALGTGLLAMIAGRVVLGQLRTVLMTVIRAHADASILVRLLKTLLDLPFPFILARGSGDLTSRMNSYFALRQLITDQISSAGIDLVFCLTYGWALFAVSAGACFIGLGCAAVSTGFLWLRYRLERELWIAETEADTQKSRTLYDLLRGACTIKASGIEDAFITKWKMVLVRHINASTARSYGTVGWQAGAQTAREAMPYLILWYGATAVLEHRMLPGVVFTALFLAGGLMAPLSTLLETINQLRLAGAYWERVEDVFLVAGERRGGESVTIDRAIELRNVSFTYSGERVAVLNDLSCIFPAGKMTAVVGPSGCGKSTLVGVLLGMLTPQNGDILYDGVSLFNADLVDLRTKVGTVLQDETLFEGSVFENIACGDRETTFQRVLEAAQRANIHDDIAAMLNGYETFLFEDGKGISGGQRQRIALARALVKRPKVLVLDEATSNLDTISAAAIETVLNQLHCTRIVISHRLSSVINADNIVVLEKGQVVEQGTHHQLMAMHSAYWNLFSAQCAASEVTG